MIRFVLFNGIFICFASLSYGQNNIPIKHDSSEAKSLERVIISAQKSPVEQHNKPLSSIDAFLDKSPQINMIRRGSYALEPFLNGMASERSVISIDGMRIYGACTDKMDPTTSYVEMTNLDEVQIENGPAHSGGAGIAGAINLKRKKQYFGDKDFSGSTFSGIESNNTELVLGSSFSYTHPKFFAYADFTYRNAENYKAGKKQEIPFSQFTKYNSSVNLGYKIGKHQHIEASLIYDHAVDVGYPALPMDVSLAKAIIGSVDYVQHHLSPKADLLKIKIYYNDITHIMDDSKRPDVPIRMDMPGWTKTGGVNASLQGRFKKHAWELQANYHHNRALAEMTMFSNNPNEKDMFMLTWPGLLTHYAEVYAEDRIKLSQKWETKLNIGLALHHNRMNNEFGFESLRIFYPELQKTKSRFLKRASASFLYSHNKWKFDMGIGYGERAPSISEGYGFYLFNSFDQFDYIGNPEMKNEKSMNLHSSLTFHSKIVSLHASVSHFFLFDYIIGKPDMSLSEMTIGAAGVKIYQQLPNASLFNGSLGVKIRPWKGLEWNNMLSYRYGTGFQTRALPMIQPLTLQSSLSYSIKRFKATFTAHGALEQKRVNAEFGEKALPGYALFDFHLSHRFLFPKQSLLIKAGVDNIFDTYYTSFADWNRLPRMGRNFFVQIICYF